MKINEIKQVKAEHSTCHSGSAQCKVALGECPCPGGVHRQAVLKCRFYCYSGVVRSTDQETIAIEKEAVTVPKRRVLATPCRVTPGSTRVSQETGVGGNVGKSLYYGF